MAILNGQQKFAFLGGLVKKKYADYLKEIAGARICIDLPGTGDFCFRLVEYLALGSCIIGPPHRTALPVPLIDRRHIVYTRDDLSDLTELCDYYLRNEAAREELCHNSRQYFDQHLNRDSLIAYYLRVCLERLPGREGAVS
jgi:hypothetical protein